MTHASQPGRSGRLVALILAGLLLTTAVYATPVAAQSGSGSGSGTGGDPCAGLPVGADWVCNGLVELIEWAVDSIEVIVRGLFEAVVQFIVDTPTPSSGGDMAFFERPDNAPWTALYDLYWQQMLPIGIGLWALIVLLLTSTRLFTHTAEGEYQRTRLERRAAFGLLMLIAWWPIGAFTLHLASALTMTIAGRGGLWPPWRGVQ